MPTSPTKTKPKSPLRATFSKIHIPRGRSRTSSNPIPVEPSADADPPEPENNASLPSSDAKADTNTKPPLKPSPSTSSQPNATRSLNVGDIANLFIKMRRIQSNSSSSLNSRSMKGVILECDSGGPKTHACLEGLVVPPALTDSADDGDGRNGSAVNGTTKHESESKPDDTNGTADAEVNAHDTDKAKAKVPNATTTAGVVDLKKLPLTQTDTFICHGAVNVPMLLRATRSVILERAENVAGSSIAGGKRGSSNVGVALVNEQWKCTITLSSQHHTRRSSSSNSAAAATATPPPSPSKSKSHAAHAYKVHIVYSAEAVRIPHGSGTGGGDPHIPVALENAKGIPGLMTVLKRSSVRG